jgi:RNA-directed DNA polymerase
MVSGTREQTEALRDDVAAVLAPIGLRLSEEKTKVVHIDEGFDFLGFRIQRQVKEGSSKCFVYTWPSKKALASITATVKAITKQGTNQPLSALLAQLNWALRGWTNYFRHGVSKATFAYLGCYNMAPGRRMAAPEVPPCQLEVPAWPLPDRHAGTVAHA